jgi:hypothetical protein
MWNCNGSASPACPERQVLPPVVTPWAGHERDGHDVLWPRIRSVHIKGGTSDALEVACNGSHAGAAANDRDKLGPCLNLVAFATEA